VYEVGDDELDESEALGTRSLTIGWPQSGAGQRTTSSRRVSSQVARALATTSSTDVLRCLAKEERLSSRFGQTGQRSSCIPRDLYSAALPSTYRSRQATQTRPRQQCIERRWCRVAIELAVSPSPPSPYSSTAATKGRDSADLRAPDAAVGGRRWTESSSGCAWCWSGSGTRSLSESRQTRQVRSRGRDG